MTIKGITTLINIIGLTLGVGWFGWWFLVPGILVAVKITGRNGEQI